MIRVRGGYARDGEWYTAEQWTDWYGWQAGPQLLDERRTCAGENRAADAAHAGVRGPEHKNGLLGLGALGLDDPVSQGSVVGTSMVLSPRASVVSSQSAALSGSELPDSDSGYLVGVPALDPRARALEALESQARWRASAALLWSSRAHFVIGSDYSRIRDGDTVYVIDFAAAGGEGPLQRIDYFHGVVFGSPMAQMVPSVDTDFEDNVAADSMLGLTGRTAAAVRNLQRIFRRRRSLRYGRAMLRAGLLLARRSLAAMGGATRQVGLGQPQGRRRTTLLT
jgi:hypothetical protein